MSVPRREGRRAGKQARAGGAVALTLRTPPPSCAPLGNRPTKQATQLTLFSTSMLPFCSFRIASTVVVWPFSSAKSRGCARVHQETSGASYQFKRYGAKRMQRQSGSKEREADAAEQAAERRAAAESCGGTHLSTVGERCRALIRSHRLLVPSLSPVMKHHLAVLFIYMHVLKSQQSPRHGAGWLSD